MAVRISGQIAVYAAMAVALWACGGDPAAPAGAGPGGDGDGGGGHGGGDTTYDWGLPPGVPAPTVPADNPMSYVKAELGRRDFTV